MGENRMFRVEKGSPILDVGIPYILVAVSIVQDTVHQEEYILIIHLDYTDAFQTHPGNTPKIAAISFSRAERGKEIELLLDSQVALAKTALCSWLKDSMGDRGIDLYNNLEWQAVDSPSELCSICNQNPKVREAIISIATSISSPHLHEFIREVLKKRRPYG